MFNWTQRQTIAFETEKGTKEIVKIFDSKKELTLTTDVSEHTVAAILSQADHQAIYKSRKLMAAEANYINIEKEVLTIIWSMETSRNFLLERKLLLKSHHKPLEFIFNTKKESL